MLLPFDMVVQQSFKMLWGITLTLVNELINKVFELGKNISVVYLHLADSGQDET